jgi:nucleoside-diphosphate-sugar epimerase
MLSVALVTGAGGFVGRQLVHELVRRGVAVRATVRSTSYETFPRQVEVRVTGDLARFDQFDELLSDVDTVFHLAARAHVTADRGGDNADLYRVSNELVTERLANAAARVASRFIFVSSIKVFGEVDRGRSFRAGDEPVPADAYGRSKLRAEATVWRACTGSEMAGIVVRPPLVYGPQVRANFLRMMQLVASGLPLPLASVSNRRSLVSSDNLIDFLCACQLHPGACGKILLVSDGADLSTPELLHKVARAMQRRARLFSMPVALLRALGSLVGLRGEISRLTDSLSIDTSETMTLLGWRPPCSVDEALIKSAQSFLASRR